MDQFIAQIILFGGNFAPRGWAFCDGQLLPITNYTALFSIIGTTYGGDGRTTFGLPDLRGRCAVHAGSGPGLTPRQIGQRAGVEEVSLTESQIPSHTHQLMANNTNGTTNDPSGNALAKNTVVPERGADAIPANGFISAATDPLTPMETRSIGNTGGSQPHENMQPSLVINYIIALEGIYPSRA